MLEDIQALPGPKRKPTAHKWNRKAGLRQGRTDMGSHIVGSFRRMPEIFAVFGYQPFEEVSQVERYVRIRVFLNNQRARSVLDENCQQPVRDSLFANPVFDGSCERVKSFPMGRDGYRRVANHPPILIYSAR